MQLVHRSVRPVRESVQPLVRQRAASTRWKGRYSGSALTLSKSFKLQQLFERSSGSPTIACSFQTKHGLLRPKQFSNRHGRELKKKNILSPLHTYRKTRNEELKTNTSAFIQKFQEKRNGGTSIMNSQGMVFKKDEILDHFQAYLKQISL